jgi:hypothetical protein
LLLFLIHCRDEISDLLKLDDVIDLVIPRGGNALVSHIQVGHTWWDTVGTHLITMGTHPVFQGTYLACRDTQIWNGRQHMQSGQNAMHERCVVGGGRALVNHI